MGLLSTQTNVMKRHTRKSIWPCLILGIAGLLIVLIFEHFQTTEFILAGMYGPLYHFEDGKHYYLLSESQTRYLDLAGVSEEEIDLTYEKCRLQIDEVSIFHKENSAFDGDKVIHGRLINLSSESTWNIEQTTYLERYIHGTWYKVMDGLTPSSGHFRIPANGEWEFIHPFRYIQYPNGYERTDVSESYTTVRKSLPKGKYRLLIKMPDIDNKYICTEFTY